MKLLGQADGTRNLADAKGDIRHEFASRPIVELDQQRRLQERELLQPDRISDDQIEFLEPDLRRPGVGTDRLADDISPLLLEAHFEEMGLKPEPFGKSREDRAEGLERTWCAHGRILGSIH